MTDRSDDSRDGGHEHRPALTRSDAWLLAALTEGSHDGRPVSLQDLVHDADWLNRLIPSFDEVSFGLPRLTAAGYMTVEQSKKGLAFRATPEAIELRRSTKPDLGGVITDMERAVATARDDSPDIEDRSLGRLPGLDPVDLETAIRDHGAWVERLSKPFIAAAQELIKRQNREP